MTIPLSPTADFTSSKSLSFSSWLSVGNSPVEGFRLETVLKASSKALSGISVCRDMLTFPGSPVLLINETFFDKNGAGGQFTVENQIFSSFKEDAYSEINSNGVLTRIKRHRKTLDILSKEPVVIGKEDGPAMVYGMSEDTLGQSGIFDLGLDGAHLFYNGQMFLKDRPRSIRTVLVACKDRDEAYRFKPVIEELSKAKVVMDE